MSFCVREKTRKRKNSVENKSVNDWITTDELTGCDFKKGRKTKKERIYDITCMARHWKYYRHHKLVMYTLKGLVANVEVWNKIEKVLHRMSSAIRNNFPTVPSRARYNAWHTNRLCPLNKTFIYSHQIIVIPSYWVSQFLLFSFI